ncbi:MAG: hypothetical protein ACP5E3_16850 [Bacteroidales bacterium]
MSKGLVYFFISFFLITSCDMADEGNDEDPIARVQSEYLYPSDIKGLIPSGLDREDSIRITRRVIEEWVRDRLLLKQAELNLPEETKNIERQVEEYRTSLLIFKYKQNLLNQNLDSLIEDSEIENYYKENSSNYVLESDIVQLNWVKVPLSAPDISNVRRWYRSENEENLQSLLKYCNQYAESFILEDTTWFHFTDILARTPLNIDNPSRYLNYNRNMEARDSNYYYFIHIINRKKEGELKPLSMVRDNIHSVLLNKRKLEYIQDLENTVYKEGLSRNQVEIY